MALLFEWDTAKAASNQRKHDITFETAARVFADPNALFLPDRIEDSELRWHCIGFVDQELMLLVVHVVREQYAN
jgi:uncharacterized DUF497 family protein